MTGILAEAFMTATRLEGSREAAVRERRSPLQAWLTGWAAQWRRRATERRTARDLRGMDDALLRDIGITRAEADELARTGRIADR